MGRKAVTFDPKDVKRHENGRRIYGTMIPFEMPRDEANDLLSLSYDLRFPNRGAFVLTLVREGMKKYSDRIRRMKIDDLASLAAELGIRVVKPKPRGKRKGRS